MSRSRLNALRCFVPIRMSSSEPSVNESALLLGEKCRPGVPVSMEAEDVDSEEVGRWAVVEEESS